MPQAKSLFECVPNVSEGRDESIISKLEDSIKKHAKLLHKDVGHSANRTVFTYVGNREEVLKASYALIEKSLELIDMQKQSGEHPRLGAVDVCPFIPLKNASIDDCVELSIELAKKVSSKLNIPVFLYQSSAINKERVRLANIRRGEFEGLEEKLNDPNWKPDYGPSKKHSSFGALTTGARDFLIAYNINLQTTDEKIAKRIAKKLRGSGEKNSCRAIGWFMDQYSCAQVSTNLTNYRDFNIHLAYEACKELAKKEGTQVTGSEIIGLIPLEAIIEASNYYNTKNVLKLESEKIELVIKKLGLSSLKEFDPRKKIIENLL